ncbi:hypothetical protein [Phenylobacterium sp.]|uniref:hypothetical protein n=1 Tax=Phenylobacterium sp. TaxID=1871053 RepID=UPI0035B3A8C6
MRRPLALKLAVLAAVVFAIAAPAVQAVTGWGLSPAEFAADGDRTIRAAGYAFSIWGLIYTALAAFAIYQILPASRDSAVVAAVSVPGAIAIAACGAWIWASAADAKWQTVGWILLGAVAAVAAVVAGRRVRPRGGWDRVLGLWPLALLAGWLTVAAAINVLTVLTARGLIGDGVAVPAAVGGVLAVVAAAFLVLRASHALVYGLPVAWGLAAVFVAERADNPPVAWTALAGAVVVLLFAASFAWPIAGRR